MKKTLIIIILVFSFALSSCWANKVEVNTTWESKEISKEVTKDISNEDSKDNNKNNWNKSSDPWRENCMKWCIKDFQESDKNYDCDWLCDSQIWIKNNDTSYCEKIKDSSFSASCYSKIAKNKNDPLICANIKDTLFINSCYMTIAKVTKDSKVCDFVTDAYKTPCLEGTKN